MVEDYVAGEKDLQAKATKYLARVTTVTIESLVAGAIVDMELSNWPDGFTFAKFVNLPKDSKDPVDAYAKLPDARKAVLAALAALNGHNETNLEYYSMFEEDNVVLRTPRCAGDLASFIAMSEHFKKISGPAAERRREFAGVSIRLRQMYEEMSKKLRLVPEQVTKNYYGHKARSTRGFGFSSA